MSVSKPVSASKKAPTASRKGQNASPKEAGNRYYECTLKVTARQLQALALVIALFVMFECVFYSQQRSASEWLGLRSSVELTKLVPESKVDSSIDYVQNWTDSMDTCRFPSFYDWDATHYPFHPEDWKTYVTHEPLNWRDELKKDFGGDGFEHLKELLAEAAKLRKKINQYSENPIKVKRNITFVHIGKAGGSSINCQLKFVRHYTREHCEAGDWSNRKLRPESAISQHVNCYNHWDLNLKCFYLQGRHPFANINNAYDEEASKGPLHGNDYLVNLRSPLDRIASWFIYEHTENHETIYPDKYYHCGQVVLNSCYKRFEDMTVYGLSGPPPPLNQKVKIGTNLTAEECSAWAWGTVRGVLPADYHNAFNYDWYAYRMLFDPRSNQSDIYALRTEHLAKDWVAIDRMLGGDGSVPENLVVPQNSANHKDLRVTDHHTTEVGIQNLCRALCEEIQVYKQLLARAVNLGPEDLAESMEELRRQCPDEVGIHPRKCPTPPS